MKHLAIKYDTDWNVLATTPRSQAAVMVISPNDSEGGKENKHPHSDQWLYVVSGTGKAIVNQQELRLVPGQLLLIEAGEPHQVINDGNKPLETLNFYASPAY